MLPLPEIIKINLLLVPGFAPLHPGEVQRNNKKYEVKKGKAESIIFL